MAKSISSKKIVTPVCRIDYPNLFQPDDNGKYTAVLLFDKQGFNVKPFKEILQEVKDEVAASVYKGGQIPPSADMNALRDGDIPNSNGNLPFKGYYYCNVKSQFQPGIVSSYPDPSGKVKANGQPAPMVITDPNEIYPGVYARACIHAYWYDNRGQKGIRFSLNGIQKVKDGERIQHSSSLEAFDCYDTAEIQESIDSLMDL